MNIHRKAQAALQYSLLIAIMVGVLLMMQVYIKRSMQGRIQAASDQLAEQYAVGETRLHEHFNSTVSTTELSLPGPWNIFRIRGSFNSESKREVKPLP